MSTFTFFPTATAYQPWETTVDLTTPLGLTNIRGFGAVQAYACSDGTYLLIRLQSGYITDIVHSTSATISDTGAWIESTLSTAGVSQGGPWLPLVELTDAVAGGASSQDAAMLLMKGDDSFTGTAGNETFLGGGGINTVDFSAATAGVHADLLLGTATGQGADELHDIQNLLGSGFADLLTGSAAANLLQGGAGADTILGGEGNDTLSGGAGADRLDGGAGADVFRFAAPSEGGDRILNYVGSLDQIEISAAGFGGGLVAGMDLAATGHYVASRTGAAKGYVAQFDYNTTTHQLFWDDDGRGGHAPVLVADLTGATGWAASELTVIA